MTNLALSEHWLPISADVLLFSVADLAGAPVCDRNARRGYSERINSDATPSTVRSCCEPSTLGSTQCQWKRVRSRLESKRVPESVIPELSRPRCSLVSFPCPHIPKIVNASSVPRRQSPWRFLFIHVV